MTTSNVTNLKKFGAWLHAHRVHRRMGQAEFAKFIGMTQSRLSLLENAKPDYFGMRLRVKIETALGERYED